MHYILTIIGVLLALNEANAVSVTGHATVVI